MFGVIPYRVRRHVRASWRSMALAAVLVGAVFGMSAASAAAARRTDSAYERFLRDARGWDALYVNYVEEVEESPLVFDAAEVRALDGVIDVHQVLFGYAALGPGTAWWLDPTGRLGSELNRAKLLDGRWFDPTDASEVVVSLALAERDQLEVGDTFELFPEFYLHQDDSPEGKAFAAAFLAAVPDLRMHVVGIVAAPGQVPPVADLGPPLMQLSPAMGDLQDADTNALLITLDPAVTPGSLRADLLELAEGRDDEGDLQLIEHDDIERDVGRSLRPQVTMLWVLAGVLALAGAVLATQIASRQIDADVDDGDALRAMGLGRRDLVLVAAARVACVAVAAALVSVGAAVALSPLAPTGLARTIEPDPGLDLDAPVLAGGLLLCAVTLAAAGAAVAAFRMARDAGPPLPRARRWSARGGPLITLGLRGALHRGSGRHRVPVWSTLVVMVTGVLAVTAALTVGRSLDHQLDDPARYGLRWDVRLAQFTEDTIVREGPERLLDDDRVVGVAVGFVERAHVGGREMSVAAVDPVKGDVRPPLVRGEYPAGGDTVAMGARTMRHLGITLGDRVDLAIDELGGESATFQVVGEVVLPPQGFGGRLDEGVLLTGSGVERLSGGEAPTALLLDMAPGASLDAVVDDLTDLVPPDGELPSVIIPATPSDIIDLRRARSMPAAFATALACVALAALIHVLVAGVRQRRRDTAVLRALGLSSGQLTTVAVYQAMILVGVAAAVGVLAGTVAGRAGWSALAATIGSHLGARTPWVVIAVLPLISVAIGASIGALAGRRAARSDHALALRTE